MERNRTLGILVPFKGSARRPSGSIRGLLLCFLLLFGAVFAYQAFSTNGVQRASGASTFTFTAAGDHGWNSNTDASLTKLRAINPAFHIALGDLGYTSDAQGWCSYMKDAQSGFSNLILITGNHDTDESGPGSLDGSNGYIASCPFTVGVAVSGTYGKEYYFDYPAPNPSIRFVLIAAGIKGSEANYDYSAGTAHYDFVANAIDDARASGIPWVAAAMHKGCIYAGDKGSCSFPVDLFNLLLSRKVDLILQAHAHYYERSKQLGCADVGTFTPSCVVTEGPAYTKGAGSVIVIDGTFGDGNRSVDQSDSEAPYFAALMDSDYGFTKYTVTAERIDAEFISSTGTFTDAYSIANACTNNCPPLPPLTASFSWSPSSPLIGGALTFTATTAGGTIPYSYAWDFGDSSTASGRSVTHSYSADGTYPVGLTVTDGANNQTIVTKSLTIPPLPPQIQTSFSFSDPRGNDLTNKLELEVWDGNTLVTTSGPANLEPSKTYELRYYYQTYLMGSEPFTPQATIETTVYAYQHRSAPDAYIAFNNPVDSLTIDEESNTRLRFTATGTGPSYTIVIKVPRAPAVVLKDGNASQFSFDSSRSLAVIDTPTLSVWQLDFEAPAQPPGNTDGGQCFPVCPPPYMSVLSSSWFVVLGGIIGLTISLAALTARAHRKLERARRLSVERR